MYRVPATRDVLPCAIVTRRRLVGRSDRYRIQALETLARFRIWMHACRPSPRLSDGKRGKGRAVEKQRTMLHQGSLSRSGRFRFGPLINFAEAAPGVWRLPG